MSEKKQVLEQGPEARRPGQGTRGRQSRQNPAVYRCLALGGQALAAGVLAAVRVFGVCSPLGVAFVAACGPGAGGFAAVVGAAGGYILSLGLDEALRYAAASILVFAVAFAFYDLRFYAKRWFMPAAAAFLTGLTGLVTAAPALRRRPAAAVPVLVVEVAAAFLFAHVFRRALARLGHPDAALPAPRRLRSAVPAFSRAVSALRSSLAAPAAQNEDPTAVYDRAADRVCAFCALREQCWQSGYQDTRDLLNAALPDLLAGRGSSAQLLPQRFRERCIRLSAFAGAVDEALESRRGRRQPLSALAGVAGRNKTGEAVSGDACAWFKDDRGRLYLMLCDGMGSGPEARRESDLAIGLVEKLLRAGCSPEDALRTLDQAFSLRLENAEGFSTVDLLALDLFSGAGTLYKMGSAPTYLKRGGNLQILRSRRLPAGLSAAESSADAACAPDIFAIALGPGDCLVMLTDGILEEDGPDAAGGDDQWLRGLLMEFDGGSPAALAAAITDHTAAAPDDKTALVLHMALRGDGALPEDGKMAV